jgi:hypothetical protein
MEQRAVILQAWGRGTAIRATQPGTVAAMAATAAVEAPPAVSDTAEAFAATMRDNPEACWEDMVPEFRAKYYDALEELIPPLLALDDPLITLNLVRFADPTSPREVELLRQLIGQCDPDRHQHSLRALAEMGQPELLRALHQKQGMPDVVKEALAAQPAAPPPGRATRRARKSG